MAMQASRRSLLGLVALVLAISVASTWWGQRHEARLGEQVAALAAPGDLRMLRREVVLDMADIQFPTLGLFL